jgi:hypothetical protein
MVDAATMGKLMQSFKIAINVHDRENPDHNSWGIGMAHFDIERLGFDEGEEILPGIVIQTDGGTSGNFRILCDGDHDADEEREEEEAEMVEAVAEHELYEPVTVESGEPAPLRPPV